MPVLGPTRRSWSISETSRAGFPPVTFWTRARGVALHGDPQLLLQEDGQPTEPTHDLPDGELGRLVHPLRILDDQRHRRGCLDGGQQVLRRVIAELDAERRGQFLGGGEGRAVVLGVHIEPVDGGLALL